MRTKPFVLSDNQQRALLSSKKFLSWRPDRTAAKRSDSGLGQGKDFGYAGNRFENLGKEGETRSTERHYTPAEVAKIWGISVDFARDIFRNEADVLALERTGSKKYTTLRIPESVLERVHNRLSRSKATI
jgi:hypothetical protein